jgi:hypothetical protein
MLCLTHGEITRICLSAHSLTFYAVTTAIRNFVWVGTRPEDCLPDACRMLLMADPLAHPYHACQIQ